MKTLAIILAMLCAGCEPIGPTPYSAAKDYTCTTEQHDKAVKEADEAAHFHDAGSSDWYYGAAIMRNCIAKEK